MQRAPSRLRFENIKGQTQLGLTPKSYKTASLTGTRSCFSLSVNSRDFVTKRTPSGISREKLAPRPGVTSIVRWVSCQCWNWLLEM